MMKNKNLLIGLCSVPLLLSIAVLPYDWEQFLRFADKYFKNK